MGCCASCITTNRTSNSQSLINLPTSRSIIMSLTSPSGKTSKALLTQYAKEVVHFSSQYGGDGSMAYVATNLANSPAIFPNYGDFTQACVFRTYGPWWEMVPSAEKPFGRTENFKGHDFIDLFYEHKVVPSEIKIYETYHPGAVIEICAAEIERVSVSKGGAMCDDKITWHQLWSGEANARYLKPQMFQPSIRHISAMTNLIRLVLDHRYSQYYTELDSVELVGMTSSANDDGTDIDEVYIEHLEKLSLGEKKLAESALEVQPSLLPSTDNGFFDMLPSELIQLIFNYLGLRDLCQASSTCTLFKSCCYDQLLYAELNLQPYWRVVTRDALSGLSGRCRQLQKLNFSWCGDWGQISSKDFIRFLEECGHDLRILRLKACRFVDREVVATIARVCLKLEELSLASCRRVPVGAYGCLQSLTKLQRLNLYRTLVSESDVIKIVQKTPEMRHLNLGGAAVVDPSTTTYDTVLQEIGISCPKLESLDAWRVKTLSVNGLNSLASCCPNLLELDVGWCSDLRPNTAWVRTLCSNCTKLKKLYLTSVRSISDNDLFAIAVGLPDLEQLDVLGAQRVGPRGVTSILEKCPKMKFLDVSFCQNVSVDIVSQLRDRYPHVAIKKSFTT